jgi:uncharacterized membrane protein
MIFKIKKKLLIMEFINKCLILLITVIMIIMHILHSIRLSQTHTHIYIHTFHVTMNTSIIVPILMSISSNIQL